MSANIGQLRKHEIPGRVAVVAGNGGLAKVVVTSKTSTAEIYPHGAHVTHFQKNGEPPLIFMSRKSYFAPGKPLRGGVPICFPWFGNRDGEPSHGFSRLVEWQLVKTTATPEGTITLHFALPSIPGREAWKNLRTEFIVTVADTLTMELVATNESCGETMEFESCLHTYFQVADVNAIALTGLESAPFDDFAHGAGGAHRSAENTALRITQETNRVYPGNTAAVEIRDAKWQRTIRVEKFNAQSTVVWNPWTTQKMPEDFDQAEHQQMVCVESGNVKADKIVLAPGKTARLKVVVSSRAGC
ncbi:MAG TPA: D-hexose-6-phosphate mutarotase [Verrucomicrobiae bacterium]